MNDRNNKQNSEKVISVVVPVYNEADCLEMFYQSLFETLNDINSYKFEVISVNDGSTDQSYEILNNCAKQYGKSFKVINFSKNFGHQAALIAGICSAKGDCIITLDSDLQHPPELIPRFIEYWQQGYKIVHSVRDDRAVSFFKRLTSRFFYSVFGFITGIPIVPGLADFRLIDKKVVQALNIDKTTFQPLRFSLASSGFKSFFLPYVPKKRVNGKSKYSLGKMMALAFESIFSFSQVPLFISFLMSGFMIFISFIFGFYVIYVKLFSGDALPGWSSIMLFILLIGAVQFFVIGIIGAYVSAIAKQVKQQPRFFALNEIESDAED